jgi:hypothetical protein
MPDAELMSRPYQPGEKCCERCVFGRGEHAEWCPQRKGRFEQWVREAIHKYSSRAALADILERHISEERARCKVCGGNHLRDLPHRPPAEILDPSGEDPTA